MPKRKKNETPDPICVKAAPEFGHCPTWRLLPGNLYQALQPTLANDYLEWKCPPSHLAHPDLVKGYHIPARPLLDLARLWKDEKYYIVLEVDTESALLILRTSQDDAGKFWSKTTLKVTPIDAEELPDWREGLPYWATNNETFIPFNLGDTAPAPTAPKSDPWIAKACSKDDARPELTRTWGNIAFDGYRAHFDPRLSPTPESDYPEWVDWSSVSGYRERLEEIRTQPANNLVSIDAQALARAAKAARTVNKETIRLNVNGSLDVYALSEETGRAGHELTPTHGYEHAGPDLEVALNPAYLLDALSGFTGQIVIALGGASGDASVSPIHLSDGTREAVIMPKQLGV